MSTFRVNVWLENMPSTLRLTRVDHEWYRLDVGELPDRLTFFGTSELDVYSKHQAFLRRLQHEVMVEEHGVKRDYKSQGGFRNE